MLDDRHRGPRRRIAILSAAAGLVETQGFSAATVEAIAEAAGVGKQTIYRWWSGRPALMVDVYRWLVPAADLAGSPADLSWRSVRDSADDCKAPEDPLTGLLLRLFRRYREGPSARLLAGLLGEAAGDEATRQAIRDGLMTGRKGLLTDRLQAVGHADPDWAADVAVALIWRQVLLGGPFDDTMARRIAATAHGATGVQPDG